jgi:hypothetical protein
MVMDEEKFNENKGQQVVGEESINFPVVQLEESIDVARKVKELGNFADQKALSQHLGIRGGALARKVVSARRWGLISGRGTLKITNLAREILYPESPNQPQEARVKAFLGVDIFRKVYESYKEEGKLPADNLLKNIVVNKFKVSDRDASTIVNIVKKSITTFIPFDKNLSGIDLSPIEKSESQKPRQIPLFKSQVDVGSVFEVGRRIGILERMYANISDNETRLDKNYVLSVVDGMLEHSSNFSSLNTILAITREELVSGDIEPLLAVKRYKSFLKSLGQDIGYDLEKKGESTHSESVEGKTDE